MIKVRELKGFKSLRAVNTFHTLLMGLKMLPAYMGESYEDFLARVKAMDDEGRTAIFREAVRFVPLDAEEVEAIVCFCTDKNDVPFTAANIKNLSPERLHECIIAICLEIGRIEGAQLLTSDEKKN